MQDSPPSAVAPPDGPQLADVAQLAAGAQLSDVAQPADVAEVAVPASFEAFYGAHFRSLVALTYALSGSRLAAEDLAQEALLAAYRRWPEVAALDDPASWVRRVAANQAVSGLRRRLAEARALTRLAGRRTLLPEVSDGAQDVWREVRRLPRRQAQAVALYYLQDRALDDVAAVLECSAETVRTHLRRARHTLADRLRLEEGDDDDH
jgi:RNA polymerase sigma-70 factor (ECF subfamily)